MFSFHLALCRIAPVSIEMGLLCNCRSLAWNRFNITFQQQNIGPLFFCSFVYSFPSWKSCNQFFPSFPLKEETQKYMGVVCGSRFALWCPLQVRPTSLGEFLLTSFTCHGISCKIQIYAKQTFQNGSRDNWPPAHIWPAAGIAQTHTYILNDYSQTSYISFSFLSAVKQPTVSYGRTPQGNRSNSLIAGLCSECCRAYQKI